MTTPENNIPAPKTLKDRFFSENLFLDREGKDKEFAQEISAENDKGKLRSLVKNLNEAIAQTAEKIKELQSKVDRGRERDDPDFQQELNWESKRGEILQSMLVVVTNKMKEIIKNETKTGEKKLAQEFPRTELEKEIKERGVVGISVDIKDEISQSQEEVKKIDPQWASKKQNEIADEIAGQKENIHKVQKGETLGAIIGGMKKGGKVEELKDKNIYNFKVEFHGKETKEFKNMLANDLPKIYPGQKVWIEGGKIIVADEVAVPQPSVKPEETELEEKEPVGFYAPETSTEDSGVIVPGTGGGGDGGVLTPNTGGDNKGVIVPGLGEQTVKVPKAQPEPKPKSKPKPEPAYTPEQIQAAVNQSAAQAKENEPKTVSKSPLTQAQKDENLTNFRNTERESNTKTVSKSPLTQVQKDENLMKFRDIERKFESKPAKENEAQSEEINALTYQEKDEKSYEAALLRTIEDQNYDFNGSLKMEKISRENFIKEVLAKSKVVNVKPPQTVAELEEILGKAGESVDFGIKFFGERNDEKVLNKVDAWLLAKKTAVEE